MRFHYLKTCLKAAVLLTAVLLLGAGLAVAQQQVNLTAGPTTVTLPDGNTVPMWGYSCVGPTVIASSTATCAALNPAAALAGTWSPVIITVPTGQTLQINLTNNLSFAAGTGTNTVPTSLVIVGQLGGGLGDVTQRTTTTPPDHTYAQGCVTWPIASIAPGQQCNAASTAPNGPAATPPTQGPRVQSFSTEVAAGATTSLTWTTPRPGTYLLESGTHPSIQAPMGLIGMLVVTEAPSATAVAPASATQGCAYTPVAGTACVVPYNAEADLLFSEIDPVQNKAVQTAVTTPSFSETRVWSGQPGGCGNPSSPVGVVNTCYPPAVNYTPLYYLINGVGFSRSNASASLFPTAPATGVTGSVLVRMVNAGLRMHVPSIVGAQTTAVTAPTGVTPTAVPGFGLVAEDGNPLPGVTKVQSEVFMAAGKTYDVMVNAPATSTTAATLPVYDRELSLSGNAIARDAGMLAYIGVNGGALPSAGAFGAAVARADTYNSLVAGQKFTVLDPGKGVIANDTNVYGVQLDATKLAANGTVTLNGNGTFTYVPSGSATSDSFGYCANGTTAASLVPVCAAVTLGPAALEAGSGITCSASSYTSNVATTLSIKPPGILAACKDGAGYPLTVNAASVTPGTGLTLSVDGNGGFTASVAAAGPYTFTYKAQNSQGTASASAATVTLTFPAGSGLVVTVLDGADHKTPITDYRWLIEEDRTFYIDPKCTTNPLPTSCTPFGPGGIVPTFGTNFHTSYMPVVAAGCVIPTTGGLACEGGQTIIDPTTGAHVNAVCDIGNGICRPDSTGNGFTPVDPSQVHLDPTKRYYISILPGDAATPFANAYAGAPDCSAAGVAAGSCGHGMGGAPIAAGQLAVTVLTQPTPFPPAKLSVFVFEDDFPLNGEQDGGGGIDILSPNEPGLGGFEITLFDDAGGTGDATGQLTHDMFNQPLSNSLAGTIDPTTGKDACPIVTTNNPLAGMDTSNGNSPTGAGSVGILGITGRIVTCPKYESDGKTLSPLAGQAVVANMMQGRYGVVATPAADRIARGEEWLQTNTLDGQKAHDSFLRVGEPSFFQEYGPAGYHVSIGFANPKIINDRLAGICSGADPNSPQPGTPYSCTHTVTGVVTTERMSRTPDERLYGSGDNSSFAFTQCYVSFGDPDGEDFAFTKCNADGTFTLTGLPDGVWRVTVFDQWNDMLVDGLSTPVGLINATGTAIQQCPGAGSNATTCDLGQLATNQWQANIYTSTFFDTNGNGVRDSSEAGLTLVSTNIRFRDGSYSNFNNTDLNGNAGFNEVFPLFSWYVVETDSTRYKSTGTHVVYDAGGPSDGTSGCGGTAAGAPPPCGSSAIATNMANTAEVIPVPANLRVPGAFYCATADCTDAPSPLAPGGTGGSTGRVDPPWLAWPTSEGWQGFSGQNSFLEFGKKPFCAGTTCGSTTPASVAENGGIHGEVNYASTRPFDDPQLLLHVSWTPDVPNVTVNLYQEGVAADGVTPTLILVDTTKTTSWDDWAQGFRSDHIPNMNCPGQGAATGTNADLFFFSLYNQPNYLDYYNNVLHGTSTTATPLPNNSQFKCYDGMHNWNQLQPAPYDGMYQFPSITGIAPTTGLPTGTNCTICVTNPDSSDPYRYGGSVTPVAWTAGHGAPMLPAGKYVVEVVVPPGYELVKEEDKNILIGDNFIAPVTQQFGGLGAIYILPDQAAIGASYNANNAQNQTQNLGTLNLPRGEGDTGSVEQYWPCVGASRIVPDYMSIFPQAKEVAAFAGATRNLCDRKEVTLNDQSLSLAKFYIFSSTHVAAHFTGVITDDFTSEFDPFSPTFGEKFSPANLPVSIKDWAGNEISRVYSDHWGAYDGLTYSSWEVNPPNPTGYGPTMMVTCMNDPGTGPAPDPLFNPGYSQFCYEIPFMPGQTQYMDTPVVPTSAFAGAGYNNVDCAYPDATPAIKEVDGDGLGPWVSAAGSTLTITALGDQTVPNYAYTGPSAAAAPWDLKTITRHYGFGPQGTVTIGGVPASLTGTGWSDTQIQVTVPSGVPNCAIQQHGAPAAQCGQLVITSGNGKQSIDTVTVTIGGDNPTHVHASDSIQTAIDQAAPGDLIIVDPAFTPAATAPAGTSCAGVFAPTATCVASAASHNEILLMWKPVRLQGVGAASSIINANAHPAGKLTVWRQQVNCLFGLALNGQPYTGNVSLDTGGNVIPGSGGNNPFDPTGVATCPGNGWNFFNPTTNNPQIDRLPLEATLGWDASLNGNLAELLQEPSLMGALEGAGITVLSKGVFFPSNPFDNTLLAGFPTGTILFTSANTNTYCDGTYPSNFQCNPSSIDGLSIVDSSQGGGGVFVHGWGHNIQIANNRIHNNSGTLSGGINIGQGEFAPSYLVGSATNAPPGSCMGTSADATTNPSISIINNSLVTNQQLPYCENLNVNVHNNEVALNSSTGDELFSATPAGAGGVSFCTGSDYYRFNYNWVCGNLSTGDGGGVGHLGFMWHNPSDPSQGIQHNTIIFNQSINPTIPANGGGIVVMGTPDVDPPCGTTTDADCVPPLGSVGPSDGIGPGLVVNANLIQGNSAESGSGGGIAFQHINGSDVVAFPTDPRQWHHVLVTNNIIADNVAGWDGAGISLLDALYMDIINNTIVSNATTASSGMLFNTLGAPLASTQGPTCTVNCGTSSAPQPAGLVSELNSAVLVANLPLTANNPGGLPAVPVVNCFDGHSRGTPNPQTHFVANGDCRRVSYPVLLNNIFYQNSAAYIAVGSLGAGTLNQQHVVTLHDARFSGGANGTAIAGPLVSNQAATGACTSDRGFWDIGVRGDTAPTNHVGGIILNPRWSVLTTIGDYFGRNNISSNPNLVSQYCDGARTPPEFGASGWAVPPGIADATVPNPLFNLTPAATVDEGNNWVNMSWGPLSLVHPVTGAVLSNYALAAGSPAIDSVAPALGTLPFGVIIPSTDFFGNPRPDATGPSDRGAIESGSGGGVVLAPTLTSIVPNSTFRPTTGNRVVSVTLTGTNLSGVTAINIAPPLGGSSSVAITSTSPTAVTANFTIADSATRGAKTVTVTAPGGTSNGVTFTIAQLTSISPASGVRGSSVNVTLTGVGLTGATAVTVSGTGVAVSNFLAVNDTTVTATFTIASTATLGGRTVTVINPGGNTSTVTFTVTGATVAFSGPAPMNTGGLSTKTGTITVSNTATGANAGPLALTAAPTFTRVSGTGTGTFTITGGSCVSGAVVNPGGSCTITVQYVPTNTSTATYHVNITDTGAATASQSSSNFPVN